MMLVDSHCHLDDERLYGQADEIVASLASDGIGRVIDAGSDLVSSERAVFLAERFLRFTRLSECIRTRRKRRRTTIF